VRVVVVRFFQEVRYMVWHRNLGKCDFCKDRTEVWKLYSTKDRTYYWVCKKCWNERRNELMTIDEIVDIAKIWGD